MKVIFEGEGKKHIHMAFSKAAKLDVTCIETGVSLLGDVTAELSITIRLNEQTTVGSVTLS